MNWIPRNYEDLVPLIREGLEGLEAEALRLTPRLLLEVLSGDAPTAEADAACRQFARTGEWPAGLPDAIRLQVSLRARAALWQCQDYDYQPNHGRTAAEILESLMTDYWNDAGRWNWIQEDVLAGDDFSGNAPRLPE